MPNRVAGGFSPPLQNFPPLPKDPFQLSLPTATVKPVPLNQFWPDSCSATLPMVEFSLQEQHGAEAEKRTESRFRLLDAKGNTEDTMKWAKAFAWTSWMCR